jgi:hypothetical protein
VLDEVDELTEAVDIQQVGRAGPWGLLREAGVVGRTHRDGRVLAVRQADDQIRVNPLANPDNRDSLPAERVMGMGNGHPSRNWLEQGGSMLWASR